MDMRRCVVRMVKLGARVCEKSRSSRYSSINRAVVEIKEGSKSSRSYSLISLPNLFLKEKIN